MMTDSLRNSMSREVAEDETNLAVIARARQDLRVTKRWTAERKLADGEHFRYACMAMAALGQRDEINPHKNSRDEWVTVGPYVSQAVTYVLHGVEHTEADRELVSQYAQLINVARRLS